MPSLHTLSHRELADLTSTKTAPETWILRDVTLPHTQNSKQKTNKRDRWTSRWGKMENWQEPRSWGTSVGGDGLHGQRGHSGTFPSALQWWLQGCGAGTSCKSSSSTPALRGSLCTLVCDSKRLPEPWALHQLCVSAREGLSSFASCRSEEQTLSPIPGVPPELKSTTIQGTCLDGHQVPCCHSIQEK